jgi:hypothetical protein
VLDKDKGLAIQLASAALNLWGSRNHNATREVLREEGWSEEQIEEFLNDYGAFIQKLCGHAVEFLGRVALDANGEIEELQNLRKRADMEEI